MYGCGLAPSFLRAALADDFVGVVLRGFALTKEQWLDRDESGALEYGSFALGEVEARRSGNAAVVVCRQNSEGALEDEDGRYDIHERFRVTLVFVRQQARWRCIGPVGCWSSWRRGPYRPCRAPSSCPYSRTS